MAALESGWISGAGEFVERFEREWARVCGREYGVSVANGSAALECAVQALALPDESEVILPTFMMISCFAAIVRCGCRPVFVDAEPRTWCMDVGQVAERITETTSAVMVAHTYGHPADIEPILELGKKHDLKVIEDAAEAHGAVYRGRVCGNFGDVSTFSFYGNKIVTSGEGGMVVCDNESIAENCRSYRNCGFGATDRFRHMQLGQNFRLTNLQAALGCAQIERFAETQRKKRRIAEIYEEILGELDDLQRPPETDGVTNAYWVYGVVLGDSYPFDGAAFKERLREAGVDSRPFFLGLHQQPAVRALGFGEGESYPVAERLRRRGLYLPAGVGTPEDDIATAARAVRKCLGHE